MTRHHAHLQNEPINMQNSSQGTSVYHGDDCFYLFLPGFLLTFVTIPTSPAKSPEKIEE